MWKSREATGTICKEVCNGNAVCIWVWDGKESEDGSVVVVVVMFVFPCFSHRAAQGNFFWM